MDRAGYSIQFVSKATGINPHTIRAWEKRYQAVVPSRTENGRRVYSDEQLERLQLLHDLVGVGSSISDIAKKPDSLLKELHGQFVNKEPLQLSEEKSKIDFNRVLQNLILALDNYKLDIVNHEFEKLSENLDARSFALDLLVPLLREVGIQVGSKRIDIGQEHALSAIIKFHVGKILYSNKKKNLGRKLVLLSTPEGEMHEFGIMLASLLCRFYGIEFVYLGTSMPISSLIDTAKQIGPDIIVLGVSPYLKDENPEFIKDYLTSLRRSLDEKTGIWVGGSLLPSDYHGLDISFIPSIQNLDFDLRNLSSGEK